MDWKEISNLSLYTDAEKERAKRDNIAINSPPVDHTQLPREILARLQPHYSDWSLQTGNINIRDLRASDTVKLFEKSGKDWTPVRTFGTGAVLGKTAYALSRRSLRTKSNKGGGQGAGYTAGTSLGAVQQQPEEQLVPTVNINTPVKSSAFKLNDKKHITTSFEDYTFGPGDTVNSVVKKLTGEEKPGAILNYNPPFNESRLPQENDTVRVAVGRALMVKGTVTNANKVVLSWTGASHGNKTISVNSAGANQSSDWEIKLDQVQPGDYSITAIASSASHQTSFSVINTDPWVGIEYRDFFGHLLADIPFRITFSDGSTLDDNTGPDGQFYKTPVPPGAIQVEFYPDESIEELEAKMAQKREGFKQALNEMYQRDKAEVDREQKFLEDNYNLLERGFIHLGAFFVGAGDGFVPDLPEIPEEVLDALGELWDAILDADREKFKAAMAKIRSGVADVADDVASALEMIMFDSESRLALVDFVEKYSSDCITSVDWGYYAGYAVGAVVMTVLLTLGTALLGVVFAAWKVSVLFTKALNFLKELGELTKIYTRKMMAKGKSEFNNLFEQDGPKERVEGPKEKPNTYLNKRKVLQDDNTTWDPNEYPNLEKGKLPVFDGKNTLGKMEVNGETYYVKNGQGMPGQALRDNPNIKAGAISPSHAEGHAIAIMRQTNSKSAVLEINHPTGPCGYCDKVIENMLPEGSKLTVKWPNGSHTFVGNTK